jgi:inorganic pyrophosphatase
MKNTITRYHHSFIGFLEMNNQGNWCEIPEVEDIIDKQDFLIKQLEINLRFEKRWRESLQESNDTYKDLYLDTIVKLQNVRGRISTTITVLSVLSIGAILTYAITHA